MYNPSRNPLLVCVSSRSLLDARSGQNTDNRVGLRPGPGRRQPAGPLTTITHQACAASIICGGSPRPCAAVWHLRWVCRRPCEMLRASELHTSAAIIPPRSCAASDCLRWVAAVVSLMTATPSHARPPSYRHGHALLAFGIWGAAAEKNGRRWGNYGGGVSVGFFGYHVFLLHPEVLICWLLVFYLLNFLFFFNY